MSNMLKIVLVYITFILYDVPASGIELFNINKEICCQGKILTKEEETNEFNTLCCGSGTFNIREELCCANKTLKLPPEALINLPTEIDPHARSVSALKRTSMPFNLNLPHYACCGDTSFNFDTELCCNDKVVKKPEEANNDKLMVSFWSCCGSELFNYSSHECCGEKILERKSFSESCCGDELIDNVKQLCCFSEYDENETPVILPRENMDIGCCGKNRIDYKNEICCMDKVIPLPEGKSSRQLTFCCGDQMWTADNDELCCNGQILKKTADEDICCDMELYNYQTHICCGDKVIPKTTNSTFCCNDTPYEDGKQVCCFNSGKVMPITDPEKAFCCE